MPAYRCERCALAFDAEQARCPKCLRKSTVVDTASPSRGADRASKRKGLAGDPAGGASGLAAFGIRWVGGAALFFGVSFTAAGLRELGMMPRLAATALGATLLALVWTGWAAIKRESARPSEDEGEDE